MRDFIILTDTRQQKEKHITKLFDEAGIMHAQTKLESGDYMAVRYNEEKGFYKDYTTLIDTKKDLLEMCGNLCRSSEHKRLVNEVELAHKLGCKDFIFLIGEKDIKSIEDIKNWSSKYTKIKGHVLLKTIQTFKEHHDCRFIIASKKDLGNKVIDLLTKK